MTTALFVVLLLYASHVVRRPRAALQTNNGIRELNSERETEGERELPVMKKERLSDRETQAVGISV